MKRIDSEPSKDLFGNLIEDGCGKSDWPKDYEAVFWEHYPRRVSKRHAMKSLARVRAEGKVAWADLLAGVLRYAVYAERKEMRFIKHAATWLNYGCWDDELPMAAPPKPSFFQQVYGRRDH